uniref:Uncharacterized protein n=1 Tax=Anguilla anguilla TaxID=7936 RepID=A0A0E9TYQ8_ANGAN
MATDNQVYFTYPQTERQTDRHNHPQTDIKACPNTGRETDRQTNRCNQTQDFETDRQIDVTPVTQLN